MSLGIDTLDAGESGMEVAGGSPSAVMDISLVPDVLQTAVSVTTEMSGFPTFAPCLEHICAGWGGGGGSVANMGFVSLYRRGL